MAADRGKLSAQRVEVQELINPAQQVNLRDMVSEAKFVKQCFLMVQTPYHRHAFLGIESVAYDPFNENLKYKYNILWLEFFTNIGFFDPQAGRLTGSFIYTMRKWTFSPQAVLHLTGVMTFSSQELDRNDWRSLHPSQT